MVRIVIIRVAVIAVAIRFRVFRVGARLGLWGRGCGGGFGCGGGWFIIIVVRIIHHCGGDGDFLCRDGWGLFSHCGGRSNFFWWHGCECVWLLWGRLLQLLLGLLFGGLWDSGGLEMAGLVEGLLMR